MEGFKKKIDSFERAFVKQRNKELNRELQIAQTKLHFMIKHLGSEIVPLPPIASFLSEEEQKEIMKEVQDTFDDSFGELVSQEQKKSPNTCPEEIRREIKNGMIYYMFYYVMKLQSCIDPSLL